MKRRRWIAGLLALLFFVLFGSGIGVWLAWRSVTLTEEQVRRTVVATLQREAPATFLISGTLDLTVTSTVSNTRYLMPDLLDMKVGTIESEVRLPGRASYGFDLGGFGERDIRVGEDGVVEVRLPSLEVHAVEPDLEAMEVRTEVGWTRLYPDRRSEVERKAMSFAQEMLREQAREHLRASSQPRVNTAEALVKMLTPPLQAAGLNDPQFRIRIGPELVMEPEG